jgi:hypothetical protein
MPAAPYQKYGCGDRPNRDVSVADASMDAKDFPAQAAQGKRPSLQAPASAEHAQNGGYDKANS